MANYDAGVLAFDGLVGEVLAELERRGLRTPRWWCCCRTMASTSRGGSGAGPWRAFVGQRLAADPLRAAAARTGGGGEDGGAAGALHRRGAHGAGAARRQRARVLSGPLAGAAGGGGAARLPDAPALIETDFWFSDRDGQPYQRVRIPYPWVYETATVEASGDIALKPEWEQPVQAAKHRGLYLGRWKLLELPTPESVKVELYDTEEDPEERRDVSAEHPDVVSQSRAELSRERPPSPGMP